MRYSFELIPPKGEEKLATWINDIIPKIGDTFDTVTIVDKATRHNSIKTAVALKEKFPGEIIPHLTLRDRTQKDFEKMTVAMRGAKITTVLALKGDAPPSGDIKDVCELITLCRANNLTVGAALNQRSDPPERIQQKITAGASFLIAQPVWDPAELDSMLRAKLLTLVPTLLILADPEKLTKYSQDYPDMDIPTDYINTLTVTDDPDKIVLETMTNLRTKLTRHGATRFHIMGDISLARQFCLTPI